MLKFAERLDYMADYANVTRIAYDAVGTDQIINFALGSPANETLPVEDAGKILADIFSDPARGLEALKYNNPRGILPLRKVAAEIMLPKRGVIGADPADILITTGGLDPLFDPSTVGIDDPNGVWAHYVEKKKARGDYENPALGYKKES